MPESDPTLDRLEPLLSELLDGQLSAVQFRELEQLLQQSAAARQRYRVHMQLHAGLAWNFYQPPTTGRVSPESSLSVQRRILERRSASQRSLGVVFMAACCALLALGAFATLWAWGRQVRPELASAHRATAIPIHGAPVDRVVARFAGLAAARFFGELGPAVGAAVKSGHRYVLRSGLAQLHFQSGVTAIIEGPAMFEVYSEDCMQLVVGNCSLHQPPGDQRFSVVTPVARVATLASDQATRLAVQVSENSQAEVHVIEGSADALSLEQGQGELDNDHLDRGKPAPANTDLIADQQLEADAPAGRLFSGQSRRFGAEWGRAGTASETVWVRYRPNTPDRVVSYKAKLNPEGRARELTHVSVQRSGQVYEYRLEDLSPAQVTSFFQSARTDFVGGPTLESPRADLIGDGNLTTGIINPGGSATPLTVSPVLAADIPAEGPSLATPGMAIQFRQPVINDRGPDIVLFEIQMMADPIEGDAFHVSPLEFKPGLRTHTIHRFDLDMSRPEALEVERVFFHGLEQTARSMEQFESSSYATRLLPHAFHALAVGIDLSDLGFAPGEAVAGLFIQDCEVGAEASRHRLDPVFIAGLPVIPED
jgi:hypothetical protein